MIYILGMADVLLDQNKPAEAAALLKPVVQSHAGHYPAIVEYAYALLKSGQAQQAVQTLKRFQLYYPDKPIPYKLLADSQAKAGNVAQAYQTRAKYYTQMGAYKAALTQLNMAMKIPTNDADTKARIQAQIVEVKQKMVD